MTVELMSGFQHVTAAGSLPERAPAFYDTDWLQGYEASGLCGGEVSYATRIAGNSVTGLLPMFAPTNSDPLGVLRGFGGRKDLITHGWHCYDTRVFVATGCDPAHFLREVLESESLRAYSLCLCNAGPDTAAVAQNAKPDAVIDMSPRFQLDLSRYANMEAYTASLSRNLRRDIKRHRRLAATAGAHIQATPMAEADRKAIADLSATIAKQHGTPWYYEAGRFKKMLDRLNDPDRFTALTVLLENEIVAASVLIRHDDVVHLWAGGALRKRMPCGFSPGTVLLAAEIQFAFSVGARLIEGGRSNAEYKARFGFEPIPLRGFLWRGDR